MRLLHQLLHQEENQNTLKEANTLMEEELDAVKRMNQMMLYSKCVTIRDEQILEKQQILKEQEEESRKLDLMMEIERLKALEAYDVCTTTVMNRR